jgi:hypothetical protein
MFTMYVVTQLIVPCPLLQSHFHLVSPPLSLVSLTHETLRPGTGLRLCTTMTMPAIGVRNHMLCPWVMLTNLGGLRHAMQSSGPHQPSPVSLTTNTLHNTLVTSLDYFTFTNIVSLTTITLHDATLDCSTYSDIIHLLILSWV